MAVATPAARASRHSRDASDHGLAPGCAPHHQLWTVLDQRRAPVLRTPVVGRHDDPLEHEADRIADRLVGDGQAPGQDHVQHDVHAGPSADGPGSLRKTCSCGGTCGSCPSEEVTAVQAAPAPGATLAAHTGPDVDAVLHSPGAALGPDTRAFFEPRLGQDLGSVQVHTGAAAARSAQSVGARAYTVGDHVVFGASEYAPSSAPGQRLLAHELVHVVQQRAGRGAGAVRRQNPSPPPPPRIVPPRALTTTEEPIVTAARRAAGIRTQIALHRVQGIVPAGPGDPSAEMQWRARQLAQIMFDWPDPNMEQIADILRSMITQLMGASVMAAGAGDPQCGTRAAYVRDFRPPVVLCRNFWTSQEQQVRTMIHEAAHLARIGSGTLDESYCAYFDCQTVCGGFEAADSWAHFVHCLSGRTPDRPPPITGRPGGGTTPPTPTPRP